MKTAAPRDWLNVHFDSNPQFGAARLRLFDEIRKGDADAHWFLPSITFADMKTYLPLQAADLLAWETRKELIQKSGGWQSTSRFAELVAAMPQRELSFTNELWDREEVEKLPQESAK